MLCVITTNRSTTPINDRAPLTFVLGDLNRRRCFTGWPMSVLLEAEAILEGKEKAAEASPDQFIYGGLSCCRCCCSYDLIRAKPDFRTGAS